VVLLYTRYTSICIIENITFKFDIIITTEYADDELKWISILKNTQVMQFSRHHHSIMLTSSRVYREIVKSHFECIAADDVYRTGRGLNVGFDLKKKINNSEI
jgi:hypothetical protein